MMQLQEIGIGSQPETHTDDIVDENDGNIEYEYYDEADAPYPEDEQANIEIPVEANNGQRMNKKKRVRKSTGQVLTDAYSYASASQSDGLIKIRKKAICYEQYEHYLEFLRDGKKDFLAFENWTYNVKKKARQIYVENHRTGGGLPYDKELTDLEAMLIQLLGKLCVSGMAVYELGLINKV
ncbi:hypothetical protein NQ315_016577 [Exocentrus adspersus]|uniref:Uncharacterized protein n=1 Tax=Exocentrus adspersus TaxID=1586481 RepID=A0AAV8V4T9_9CUCU|nr:hypothetical protein NQ315_016577 [Exocentrus adspersus]